MTETGGERAIEGGKKKDESLFSSFSSKSIIKNRSKTPIATRRKDEQITYQNNTPSHQKQISSINSKMKTLGNESSQINKKLYGTVIDSAGYVSNVTIINLNGQLHFSSNVVLNS